jgi:hypothetical protein
VAAVPWTQLLAVSWRPQLRFYDERIRILHALEERGALRSFAVEEHRIGARVSDNGHELTFRRDGMTIDVFGPVEGLDAVWDQVALAQELLQIGATRRATARFRYVAPLDDMAFEEALAATNSAVFSLPSDGGVIPTDYALLFDATLGDGVTGQIEFGIVRGSAEARRRLTGVGERIGPVSPAAARKDWSRTTFPDVALFVDASWEQKRDAEDENLEAVRELWTTWNAQTGAFVDGLQELLVTAAKRGV